MTTVKSIFIGTLLVAAGAAFAAEGEKTVILKNGKGADIGEAVLSPLAHGVKLVVNVHGLTPGEHAIHFHEKASCQGPDFKSAGGHFSPTKTEHGFNMKGGPHPGDMPNFFAAADGTAHVETVNEAVSLTGEHSLLKGTSIIIHEKADDYKSQPAGDAGGRAACGVIKE